MKIKLLGTINKMSLKKDGEYRVEFKFPLSEIVAVVSTVKLLNTSFSLGVRSEGKDKAVIPLVYFYRMAIDRDGESKLSLSFSFDNISDKSLAFFGQHQDELLVVIIKYGEEDG